MGTHAGSVMTLANSIIGVSVLAMPFCFKQCGIVLSIVMLLVSSIVSRLASHYLIKAAIMEKRRNFEMLAFRAFGPTGKLMVELCVIGFMLGTCVAYFVVVGDLGPAIMAPILGFQHPTALRPSVLIGVAVFVVLPLGLLRNVDSLSTVSAASIAFYSCLVLKVFGEATTHLLAWDWMDNVHYWRPAGFLRCIPIFSMALSCQTQLFEIFDSLPNTPLDRMNAVVKSAINLTTMFYIAVGLFGYIAYCNQSFTGNLMMNFSPTLTSDVVKIGFVLSVAVSFPLVIFPCRASLYSLLFSKGHTQQHELTGSAHIPETKFQCITLLIVTCSLITGLLIPNIELVLGLVGSTIGVFICLVFPAVIFVTLSTRNTNERLLAKVLVGTGLIIMVLSTYTNLHATNEAVSEHKIEKEIIPLVNDKGAIPLPQLLAVKEKVVIRDETLKELKNVKDLAALPELNKDGLGLSVKEKINKDLKIEPNVRQEPPIPIDPETKNIPVVADIQNNLKKFTENVHRESDVELKETIIESKTESSKVDLSKMKIIDEKKADLIEKLKEHNVIHKKIMEEEEKLLNQLQDSGNKGDDNGKQEKPIINLVDKIKVMDVKTGLLSDVRTLKPLKVEDEAIKPEPQLVALPKLNDGAQADNKILSPPKPASIQNPDSNVKRIEIGEENGKSKDNLKEQMVNNIAKGIPLPVAIKENIIKLNSNISLKKGDTIEMPSRDILQDVKEREKRDLEEVNMRDKILAQNTVSDSKLGAHLSKNNFNENFRSPNISHKTDNTGNPNIEVKHLDIGVESDKVMALDKLQPSEIIAKECGKRDNNRAVTNETSEMGISVPDKVEVNGSKVEAEELAGLIRTPSYLSDVGPVLDGASVKIGESDLDAHLEPGRPLKRDLKSVDEPQHAKKAE